MSRLELVSCLNTLFRCWLTKKWLNFICTLGCCHSEDTFEACSFRSISMYLCMWYAERAGNFWIHVTIVDLTRAFGPKWYYSSLKVYFGTDMLHCYGNMMGPQCVIRCCPVVLYSIRSPNFELGLVWEHYLMLLFNWPVTVFHGQS